MFSLAKASALFKIVWFNPLKWGLGVPTVAVEDEDALPWRCPKEV